MMGGIFEYFGKIKTPIPTEGPGGWVYNSAYCKHLLAKSMFDTINAQLNNINAYPYYYYSPIPGTDVIANAQQIKYNMGILKNDKNNITSGDYRYDSDGYASDETSISASTKDRIDNNFCPFGVYSEHIGLKRSKGLAWPLFNVTTNDITKQKLKDIGFPSGFVNDLTSNELNQYKEGCIILDNKTLNNKTLYPNLNNNNYKNVFFINKPEICTPSVYNIPLVFETLDNKFIIEYNNKDITSSCIDFIKYPKELINHYTNNGNNGYEFSETTSTYNIGFLNLDKLYNKMGNNINFKKLTFTWNVSQNLGTGLIFGYIVDSTKSLQEQEIIFDLKTWDGAYSNIDTATLIQNQIKFIKARLSKDIVIGIQFSSIEIDKAEISNNMYNFNSNEGKEYNNNNHTLKIKYLDLGKYLGSIEYEYRGRKTDKNYDNNVWTYTQSYTFKNKSDFILFYYFYKHLTNFYLIKFNKIWNNILLMKNDITRGTFNDALKNPTNYFNGNMTAIFISYANIISDSLLWNGFCNDPISIKKDTSTLIDDSYYSTTDSSKTNSCNPFGNMAWTIQGNHSDIIGQPWIPSKAKNRIENPLLSAEMPGNVSEKFGIQYNNDMKKLFSIYRPKYIDFYNMNICINENTDLYTLNGFTGGIISCKTEFNGTDSDNQIVTGIINGYALNYAAFNMDYGWSNEYTFENIVSANIPAYGCI